MKKVKLGVLSIMAIVISTAFGILSDNGKARYTGSPSELKCDDCHNTYGNSNTGPGTIYVTSSMNNWQYVLGQTYTINVIVKQTGKPLFGVGFEALTATNANAGSLVITNGAKTQTKTKTVNGITRNNVVHQLNGGLQNDSMIFTFNWVAPTSNLGNITFYFAGIAANNNGSEDNDYVYHSTKVVSPASATAINENVNTLKSFKAYINGERRIAVEFYAVHTSQPRLNLFDMNGRLISSELMGVCPAGEVKSSMNIPTDLRSGNYMVSILTNNQKLSSKIFIP
jgi:Reeler domain